MYELIFKPKALATLRDGYLWYEQQQVGLGELFQKELDSYFHKLQTFPLAYSKTYGDYREAKLKQFPYVIVFEIHDKTVVIYSVFHTSRNPKKK